MKTTWKAALAATFVAGTAGNARADLTLNGAVGLPLNPTAQIPAVNGVRLQGDYAQLGDVKAGGATLGDLKLYGLHAAGRLDMGNGLEISGGVEKLNANENVSGALEPLDTTGFAIGGKYLIIPPTEDNRIAVAAGAGYSRALFKNTNVYLVGTSVLQSRTDRKPLVGHLGLRWDRFEIPGTTVLAKDDSSKLSVYGGLEVPITRDGSVSLVGELQSKNNKLGAERTPYSALVRWRPNGKGYGASIGMVRQGVTGDNGLLVQIGYTFNISGLTQ